MLLADSAENAHEDRLTGRIVRSSPVSVNEESPAIYETLAE